MNQLIKCNLYVNGLIAAKNKQRDNELELQPNDIHTI